MSSTVEVGRDPEDPTRRKFLERLSIALGAIAASVVGAPIVGFVFEPLLRKTTVAWRRVGMKDEFRIGNTVEVTFEDASPMAWSGVTARTGAWLRRVGQDEFIAFALNCTHLGCPVRWVADAELFMCPCHGGVYYSDGRVAGGPPPRPLPRYPVRLRGGEVQIRTSPIPIT
jgi:menaquinol-cytochrome c reductase iron-sulfur subunit